MTESNISQVATVFAPVADQERALAFYMEKLGWEKRGDFTYGGHHRWVEVAPPGSTYAVALVPASEGESRGPDVTRCALLSSNIEADHAALSAAGVDVDSVIAREGTSRPGLVSADATVSDPVPPQFLFRDLDGNQFLIVGAG
jgi:catechol 2,3-dioxygenase-like lactoylglutathione lyase family enzyme